MTDEPRLNVKVIHAWGPTCDTGRHNMPHPDDTCDEADQWITLRDQLLKDFIQQAFERIAEPAVEAARLGTNAVAAALADPIPPPEHGAIQRALDILAPHLARQPLYRA